MLGVNRTSFYDWERRPPSDRALTDAWLTEKIKQIHKANRGVYGAPRIHAELRLEHGIRVGRKRVARLMKAAAIAGVKPRKRWRTTIRVPGIEPATDLVERDFRPASPNVLWVSGHHLPAQRGRMALSRRGAGPLLATDRRLVDGHPHARNAGRRRAPDGARPPAPRARADPPLRSGSQYVSLAFGRAARQAGIAISMGSRGDAYDNARRSSRRSRRTRQPPQLAVAA